MKHAIAALALVSLVGCTTLQPVADVSAASLQQRIEPGDRVVIHATDGRDYPLTVTQVDADAIYGYTGQGQAYKIVYAAIASMQIREVHAGRTTGLVAGVLGTATVVVLVVVVVAGVGDFFEAFSCAFVKAFGGDC